MQRIYFFEGPPGAGKSSLSQWVAQQLTAAGAPVVWLEEHTLNATVFNHFLTALDDAEQDAIASLLADWRRFLAGVAAGDAIYCLDGAFFHSTLSRLYAYHYSATQIAAYLATLYNLLTPLAPPLIHLTGDVTAILRAIIAERGARWVAIIAQTVAIYPCLQGAAPLDAAALTRFFVDRQRELDTVAAAYPFAYYRNDTTARDWTRLQREVSDWLDIAVQPATPPAARDLPQYVGVYQTPAEFPPEFNHPFTVEQTADGLRLHMFFMRNLRLAAQEGDCFAIVGRPNILEFVRDEGATVVGAIYPFVPDQRFFCTKIGDENTEVR
ncbi:MAG: hypothetical protein KDE47_17875 [Caldilineaceae bacterium]|nr:hypothetical protein [Caldilineaceae bacterium]